MHPPWQCLSVLRRTGNEDLHGPCGDARRFWGSFLTQRFFSYRSGVAMATADCWLLVIFRFERREPLPTWDFSTAKSEMTLRSVVLAESSLEFLHLSIGTKKQFSWPWAPAMSHWLTTSENTNPCHQQLVFKEISCRVRKGHWGPLEDLSEQ